MGCDVGGKGKGREIHACVDTLGLPTRANIHSAGTQDRNGAALVFDKIRGRSPWLKMVWANGGYNARQVKDAVPSLRMEVVKRTDDIKGVIALPRPLGGRAHFLSVRAASDD